MDPGETLVVLAVVPWDVRGVLVEVLVVLVLVLVLGVEEVVVVGLVAEDVPVWVVAADVADVRVVGATVTVGSTQLLGRATKPHSKPTNNMIPRPPAMPAISTGSVTEKAVFFAAIILDSGLFFRPLYITLLS